MKNHAPFPSSISFARRRFVILDHSIKDTKFIVKIYYDKKEFGHLISEFIGGMIRAIKQNKELNGAGWNNATVFVDENEVSEYFECCAFLTVQSHLKKARKKMSSAIECVFQEFKDQCNIEHALINKFVGPKEFKISA